PIAFSPTRMRPHVLFVAIARKRQRVIEADQCVSTAFLMQGSAWAYTRGLASSHCPRARRSISDVSRLRDVAHDLDADAQRVARQIGDGNALGSDERHPVRRRAGLAGPLLGEAPAARDRLAAVEPLEYLIDLAADLRDRGADRIGAAAVLDANDAADPLQPI